MIDTDKYEGHTPAPWMMGEYKGRPSIHAGNKTFVRSIARGLNPSQIADHALLLDAPLLLEYVKGLTKTLELIGKNMPYDSWMHTLIKDVIGFEKWQAKEMKKND